MATARKRLAKNFQFRLDRRTVGPYNARQDGPGAASGNRLQPCALLAEAYGTTVDSLIRTEPVEGIGCVGRREKTRHRARFGISVDKAYWGLGIGPVRRVSQRAPFRRVAEKDFMGGRKT